MKKHSSNLLAAGLLTTVCLLVLNAQAVLTQAEPTGYTQTRHPIMLVQGILAFDSIAGVENWYKISEKLQSEGATVYTAEMNAFNNSVARGEQLIKQLENIRATYPSVEKFNLVAHSQGGLTSRYVMSVRPDLVASVTTIGTPHTGTPIADFLNETFPEDTLLGGAFERIGDALGDLIDKLSGDDLATGDTRSLVAEFTASGAAAFNAQFPLGLPTETCGEGPASITVNGHDIRLYSWSGGDTFTNIADPLDYLVGTAGLLFAGEINDGITSSCGSHFGTVIRDDYQMNHLDLINQVLGLYSLFSTDPLTLFRTHANRLKQIGL